MSVKHNIEDIYPLAPMQSGILFEYLYNSTAIYHEQNTYKIKASFNPQIIAAALAYLSGRHTILRTAFVYEGVETPLQVVLAERDILFSYTRLPEESSQEQLEMQLANIRDRDRLLRFDLVNDPLMRVSLVEIKRGEYEFIWTFHHIIMDGWCINILIAEFYQAYKHIEGKQQLALSPAVPYSRFIQFLAGKDKKEDLRYWKNYLKNYDERGGFPRRLQRPGPVNRGKEKYLMLLGPEDTMRFKEVCGRHGIMESVFIRTAWAVVLSKYMHKDDIVFGSIVHGRPPVIAGSDEMVGLFINNIPVRVQYDEHTSFINLLKTCQYDLLESEKHQYVSIAEIRQKKKKLFDSIFLFQNFKTGTGENTAPVEDLNIINIESTDNIPYDLIVLASAQENILLEIKYDTAVYDQRFVAELAANLKFVLMLSLYDIDIFIRDIFVRSFESEHDISDFFLHRDIIADHRQRSWWLSRFNNPVPASGLKHDLSGLEQSYKPSFAKYRLHAAITAFMKQHPDQHMLRELIASVEVLLYRYTGQEDIVIGTFMPDEVNGEYLNSVPLRNKISGDDCFATLRDRVKQTIAEAQLYDRYNFSRMLKDLMISMPDWEGKLFDVMVLSVDSIPAYSDGTDILKNIASDVFTRGYPSLIFLFRQKEDDLELTIQYNGSIYSELMIERLLLHYEHLMLSVVAENSRPIRSLDILTEAEKELLLLRFNDTHRLYDSNKTLTNIFEQQVAASPEDCAVVFEGRHLTYKELDRYANRLGNYLKGKGVRGETIIGLCLERSMEMIIGILGVLKAGAAYMPVDPAYPAERINYMLEDSGCKIVITGNGFFQLTDSEYQVEIINLDLEMLNDISAVRPDNELTAGDAAYVIYTSGSTGRPKGVVNEHKGIVNRLLWMQEYFGLSPEDAVLQKTTFCFDISVWELLWPLIAGARLVFAKPDGQKDLKYLRELITLESITTIHFVPSMLEVFLDDMRPGTCKSLKRVLCSGEALKSGHVNLFREKLPDTALHNLYGPTEAAIDVCCWDMPFTQDLLYKAPPIGKPIANTSIYILDPWGGLVPIGVEGELHIGGVQVSRGYINRVELTSQRFVQDPFRVQAGAYMYKSGDMARRLEDGNIDFSGRKDEQIKIRGYRIEPGEIEYTLLQSGFVKQVVVMSVPDRNGNERLVAHLVPLTTFNREAIIAYLKEKLPAHMVPALLIKQERIPLTENGKVDKKLLSCALDEEPDEQQNITPGNETELKLLKIWEKVLGLPITSVRKNFFELGGHSLHVLSLISAIRQEFEVELTMNDILYEHATLESLATYLHTIVYNV